MIKGFEAYKIWRSLHVHFTTLSYDAVKSRAWTQGIISSFERSSNIVCFEILEDRFKNEIELGQYLISNFIAFNDNAAFDISPEAQNNYKEWKKRKEARTYLFSKDINDIIQYKRDLPIISENEYCKVFQCAISKRISPETVCILNKKLGFLDEWYSNLKSSVFSELVLRWLKYQSFVKFNEEKVNKIIECLPRE